MTSERVRWNLLGGPEIQVGERVVTVRFDRSRAVMSYLVLHANERVRTDRLIDELWQHDPPKSARNSVQRFVADLRKDLGDAATRIESVTDGYLLRLDPDDRIDVDDLAHGVQLARHSLNAGDPRTALRSVPDDLDLAHRPFEGLDDTAFVATESVRLENLTIEAVELRLRCNLDLGHNASAATDARSVIERQPYREGATTALMLALYRDGQAADALRAAGELRTLLREETGCDPTQAVRDLEQRILTHDPSLHLVPSASSRSTPGHSMVGRDVILADLDRLLDTERFVTLLGPGGIGKTTLADAAASRWGNRTGGTVYLVELGSTTTAGFQSAVGEVLGISPRPDEDRSLEVLDRLGDGSTLLVLDNCEHVLDATHDFVAAVQQHAPHVRVLATSRSAIGNRTEVLRRLDVLDESAGKQLFLAETGRLGVQLDGDEAIDQLLTRLDGLPLAIELTASALQTLSIADVLKRAETTTAGPDRTTADFDERHRSIDASVAWSMSLIGTDDVAVLLGCATFARDFDLDALGAITGIESDELLGVVSSLVEKSLLHLHQRHQPTLGTRYRLLAPIRDSLRARSIDDIVEKHRRLVDHYVMVAEQGFDEVCGRSPSTGINRLRSDVANFRLAFELADAADDVSSMQRFARALGWSTGMAPRTLAHGALQDLAERLEQRLTGNFIDDEVTLASLAWAHSGRGHWAWLRELPDCDEWRDVSAVTIAMAMVNSGHSARAQRWMQQVDIDAIESPAMKAWAAASSAALELHRGDDNEYRRLRDITVETAKHHNSVVATYWANLTHGITAFARLDFEGFEVISDRQLAEVSGHDLASLEHHVKQVLAGAAFALKRRDPLPILIDVIGETLQQSSPGAETEAIGLDTAVLFLHEQGRDEAAALLAGLLRRLGILISIYATDLNAFHSLVDADADLTAHRRDGQAASTIDVLQRTYDALVELRDAA